MKTTKILIIAIFTGVSFVNVQAQDSRGSRGDAAGALGGGGEFLELFKNDKNMDGKITKNELPADRHEWINDYDTDGDGAVSRREARLIAPSNQINRSRPRASARGGERRSSAVRSSRSSRPSRSGGSRPSDSFRRPSRDNGRSGEAFFLIFDADGDGVISGSEMRNASQALYKLDVNGDKRLSRQELGSLHNATEEKASSSQLNRSRSELERSDSSRQNFISRIFDYDKDGNGMVSRKEMPDRMQELLQLGDRDKDGAISRREAGVIYDRASRR